MSRLDLTDIPLQNPELELFTDGSSFIQDGQHKAGYAITTDDRVKAEALPQGWSPLQAELWAPTQALQHAKGKGVNFYTEARYAFATLLMVHGAIYKERGLLTEGKGDKK